jgi:hypothetical protein
MLTRPTANSTPATGDATPGAPEVPGVVIAARQKKPSAPAPTVSAACAEALTPRP